MYYVYFLKLANGDPYIGCTNDLKDRISRHSKGQVASTCNKLPLQLKRYFAFDDEKVAFRFEKYLKSGSGRAFTKKHFN